MNAVSASRSNGHLRRCRFGIPPHVRPQSPGNASYLQEPPSTLRRDSSLRLASDALLRDLQGACGRIDIRALGALRFLNRFHT